MKRHSKKALSSKSSCSRKMLDMMELDMVGLDMIEQEKEDLEARFEARLKVKKKFRGF